MARFRACGAGGRAKKVKGAGCLSSQFGQVSYYDFARVLLAAVIAICHKAICTGSRTTWGAGAQILHPKKHPSTPL